MSTDYSAFDADLIAVIRSGVSNFTSLSVGSLRTKADAIAKPDRYGDSAGWRVIDRRLQALRKKGALKYDRKNGWTAA